MTVIASSANASRWSLKFRSRLDAALAANSAATTSRRFAATIWPLRDSRFFILFRKFYAPHRRRKMGFRPHIGKCAGNRQ